MALDMPLPKQILAHAHWTIGHRKMSKSTGNVVSPFFALDRFGTDTMRFCLAHDGGIRNDADYDNAQIIERYSSKLRGAFGNLASRVTRAKTWSVRAAVKYGCARESWTANSWNDAFSKQLKALPARIQAKMDALDSGAALKEIMTTIDTVSGDDDPPYPPWYLC